MAIRDNLKGGSSKKLYEALQYSGLVTEDMTFAEMCEVLAAKYPELLYIYKHGNNCDEVTGGWENTSWNSWGHSGMAPTITFGESTMKISGSSGITGTVKTKRKIDVTNFATLSVTVSGIVNGGFVAPILCRANGDFAYQSNLYPCTNGTKTVDISSYTGEWYVGLFCSSDNTYNAEVTDVILGV